VDRGTKDALPPDHLGDNLIRTNVHLELRGRLEEFSHSGEFPDCRQEPLMDFIGIVSGLNLLSYQFLLQFFWGHLEKLPPI
jgi:hypothetical protein